MLAYIRSFLALGRDNRAVTALEYALVAGVLATVIGFAYNGVGGALQSKMVTNINQVSTQPTR